MIYTTNEAERDLYLEEIGFRSVEEDLRCLMFTGSSRTEATLAGAPTTASRASHLINNREQGNFYRLLISVSNGVAQ